MKLLLALAIVVLMACCLSSSVELEGGPWFCHNYDCPKFKMLKSAGKDLELREYEKTVWVTTNVTNKKLMDAQVEGYRRLQQYLDKGNDGNEKIAQTNPVFTVLYPTHKAPERSVEANFTIEFFVPHKYHDEPPKPRRGDADILVVEPLRVYVQSFGGYATEKEIIDRGFDLMDNIKQGGEDVFDQAFGFAQYDSWVRVLNRHNEIWVWLKQQPSS